ncbi:MAG: AAA family ATPase [Rhizobiales bacterium]|nr:AAA family ATPase [Hyphomicrobiales bacterium]
MSTDDGQKEVVGFLAASGRRATGDQVDIITTHISKIFLVADRVFKLKRALVLPYVDFSTPELRLAACEKEVALNSATAPRLYCGVRRITRENGGLAFDGDGPLADAVVEMERFDQSALLDQMAGAGALTPDLITATSRMIVRFHRRAPVVHAGSGVANMEGVLDINRAGFDTSRVFGRQEIEALDAAFRAALRCHAPMLDRRQKEGRVRRCHGDLHLRNICLLDGEPCLFDCIEFNDRIATVDVLYDLAFLLMDLWHRGLPDLASLVMNRYLDETDEESGLAVVPFFMAVRAAVRAHVTATQAESGDDSREIAGEARRYFALAADLLVERPGRLIAIGGFSGSGKSTIAGALAPHVGAPPGARIIESDRIRKALFGVAAETRLPGEAYRPEVSERVYGEMCRRAGEVLGAGASVVANAVFDRRKDRQRIEQEAGDRHVPFRGIWLEAPPDLLRDRVGARVGGASDASVDVLAAQLARGAEFVDWRKVDAARIPARIVADILAG